MWQSLAEHVGSRLIFVKCEDEIRRCTASGIGFTQLRAANFIPERMCQGYSGRVVFIAILTHKTGWLVSTIVTLKIGLTQNRVRSQFRCGNRPRKDRCPPPPNRPANLGFDSLTFLS